MNDDQYYSHHDELIQKLRHDWNQIFSDEVPDGIIQIAPIKKRYPRQKTFFSPEIFNGYLIQYGEVESTNIRFKNNVILCGLIKYKDSKVADNLIGRSQISFADIEYEVKPINKSKGDHQLTDDNIIERLKNLTLIELKLEPLTHDTKNNILTILNDDCLRLIFKQFHRLRDFHSVSNVCEQFNRISKEVFPSKIKHENVRFIDLMDDVGEITLTQIEIFLSNFGSSIFSANTVTSYLFEHIPDASNIFLKLIYKHCKNLRELHVGGLSITKEFFLENNPVFSQLKRLDINLWPESDFDLIKDCLVHCTQLETLRINGCSETTCTLPAINIPKLVDFENSVDAISSDEFLEKNPQIEKLNIHYSLKLCGIIANKLSNIQKLTLSVRENGFTETDNIHLRHLKHVDLDMYLHINNSIRNLYIFPMKNITKLFLYIRGFFDQNLLIELIQNLHYLKHLTISKECENLLQPTNEITIDVLKEILQYGNQLSELRILCAYNFIYHFDERDYYDILEIIKKRTNDIKVNINIECTVTKIVYSQLNHSSSIERMKFIHLNMFPKWLDISVSYSYDQWNN